MRGALLLALVFLASCVPPREEESFHRIELTVCDGGDACSLVADGASLVTVHGCVSNRVEAPLSDVAMKLTLSAGSWSGPKTDEVTGSIKDQRCLDAVLIAPFNTREVRVDAVLGDFRRSLEIALAPATLSALDLVPSPSAIAPGETNDLQVKVHSVTGKPTAGTSVALRILAQTPGAPSVEAWPRTTTTDADGSASFSVYAASGITSVTYEVTASAPAGGNTVIATAVVPAKQ